MSRRHESRLARLERQITIELPIEKQIALSHDSLYDPVAAERFTQLHREGRINGFVYHLWRLERQGPCDRNCGDRCDPELCPIPENQRISAAPRKEQHQ